MATKLKRVELEITLADGSVALARYAKGALSIKGTFDLQQMFAICSAVEQVLGGTVKPVVVEQSPKKEEVVEAAPPAKVEPIAALPEKVEAPAKTAKVGFVPPPDDSLPPWAGGDGPTNEKVHPKLRAANTLRAVLEHFASEGVEDISAIVDECVKVKQYVPALQSAAAATLETRIRKAADVLGIGKSNGVSAGA